MIFNIFIKDIYYILRHCTLIYNADDNTVSYSHKELTILKEVLEEESLILIQRFADNFMKANPGKFQSICVSQKAHAAIKSFQLHDTTITSEDEVTPLGVSIDHLLNSTNHIHVSEICKKSF